MYEAAYLVYSFMYQHAYKAIESASGALGTMTSFKLR